MRFRKKYVFNDVWLLEIQKFEENTLPTKYVSDRIFFQIFKVYNFQLYIRSPVFIDYYILYYFQIYINTRGGKQFNLL